jgi:hypothetical protein
VPEPPLVQSPPLSNASWVLPFIFHHPLAENKDDMTLPAGYLGLRFSTVVAVACVLKSGDECGPIEHPGECGRVWRV